MSISRRRQIAGATLGLLLIITVIAPSPYGLTLLRDVLLAGTLFTYGGTRLWRRVSRMPSVGPVVAWHGGQLLLAAVAAAVVFLACTLSWDPFYRAFPDDIINKSSIPRLIFFAISYLIVACPIFLFWASWLWLAARRGGRDRDRVV